MLVADSIMKKTMQFFKYTAKYFIFNLRTQRKEKRKKKKSFPIFFLFTKKKKKISPLVNLFRLYLVVLFYIRQPSPSSAQDYDINGRDMSVVHNKQNMENIFLAAAASSFFFEKKNKNLNFSVGG